MVSEEITIKLSYHRRKMSILIKSMHIVGSAASLGTIIIILSFIAQSRSKNDSIEDLRAELLAIKIEGENFKSQLRNSEKKLAKRRQPKPVVDGDSSEEPFTVNYDHIATELESWIERTDRLLEYLLSRESLQIPEMQFLTENDWLVAAKSSELKTEADFRRALSELRSKAKGNMAGKLQASLKSYIKEHAGEPLSDPQKLIDFVEDPIEKEVLSRFEIDSSDNHPIGDDKKNEILLIERDMADEFWDSQLILSPEGVGLKKDVGLEHQVLDAILLFEEENARLPSNAGELESYVGSEVSLSQLTEMYEALSSPPK